MRRHLAQVGLVLTVGLLAIFFALQTPALAQKGLPPTAVPPKGIIPTPPSKQSAPSSNQETLAPTGGSSPDYSQSGYQARGAHAGETITYILTIRNVGTGPGTATIAQVYPPTNTVYVVGSAQVLGGGSLNATASLIVWSGTVNNNASVTITYRVVLPNSIGTLVESRVSIYDPGLIASVNLNNQLTTQAKTGGPDGFGYT